MKLTKAQRNALLKLANLTRPASASKAKMSLATLRALESSGLVKAKRALGSIVFPHSNIEWSLTPAGRAALAEACERAAIGGKP